MTQPRPWTDADTARLTDLHAQGNTLTAIAREMGRSKAMVSRYSAATGLTYDRSQTEAAARAKSADAKDRRATLQLRGLARAEALYDRLEAATFTTLVRQAGGSEVEQTLKFVPPKDERDIALTIRTHLEASIKLDLHDSGAGAAQVVGLLQRTAAALGLDDGTDPA